MGSSARGPLSAQLERAAGLRPTDVKRLLAWRSRIRRDASAMHDIVARELGPSDAAVDVGAHAGEITAWFVEAAPRWRPRGRRAAARLRRAPPRPLPRRRRPRVRAVGPRRHGDVLQRRRLAGVVRVCTARIPSPASRRSRSTSPSAASTTSSAPSRCGWSRSTSRVPSSASSPAGARRSSATDRSCCSSTPEFTPRRSAPRRATCWALLDELDDAVAPVADESQVLDRTGFVALCEVSHASGYDRHAVTNWVARPR